MKKILFILFAVLMTALTACNNHKISSDDLVFIQKSDSTLAVYYNGKPFNGEAYLNGVKSSVISVDNGEFFSFSLKKGRGIIMDLYPTEVCYYDQSGNYISEGVFRKLYPDVTPITYDDIVKLCQ